MRDRAARQNGGRGFLPVPLADLDFVTDYNARALAHLEASVGPR
jgi:hypothetical protein